jgi:hypothetical protein
MDNKNNQKNFPDNQADCPSSQNKNSQNKSDDKAQQKKSKKEEF